MTYFHILFRLIGQDAATLSANNNIQLPIVAINEQGGKRNFVKNINAQHKVLKRPIITETIETEINFTDISSLVL